MTIVLSLQKQFILSFNKFSYILQHHPIMEMKGELEQSDGERQILKNISWMVILADAKLYERLFDV